METKRKGYIESLIEQGEHEHQDFKYQITDARKIARSISAFANHGGGRLLVGVKDNGSIVGVSSDEEIYKVANSRLGWYRRSAGYVVNYALSPKILGTKAKDRPGLVDPLAYYLSRT